MVAPEHRILYSEDDLDHRELICLMLREEGLETVCASPLEDDVLRIAKEQKFDLYLLDNWTSGMSGVEVCKRIREFDPHTPIIFYSAAASERDKEEAFAAGAQGYITKPADFDEVMSAIRKALLEIPEIATASPTAR